MKRQKKSTKDTGESQKSFKLKEQEKGIRSSSRAGIQAIAKPTAAFTQALAREIVRNLTTIGQITSRPFRRQGHKDRKRESFGDNPILLDTSILIDGRIVPIVNSGFLSGTLVVPEFILTEVQHIADSSESIRRAKGRRGLEVVGKLKSQKANRMVKVKIVREQMPDINEVDHKLVALAERWKTALLTVDFNLAHLARARGIRVLNINDLAQALKIALVPGEELLIKITHEGREREQGVGYLTDGTMVVVDRAKDKVGSDIAVIVTKIHQTPAGQLFFARLK